MLLNYKMLCEIVEQQGETTPYTSMFAFNCNEDKSFQMMGFILVEMSAYISSFSSSAYMHVSHKTLQSFVFLLNEIKRSGSKQKPCSLLLCHIEF